MERRRRIAVVGGGIAGMSAAYHLARYAPKGSLEVTLYEAAPDIGGHEMSVDTKFGRVDLGFMVLNRETVRTPSLREQKRSCMSALPWASLTVTHTLLSSLVLRHGCA